MLSDWGRTYSPEWADLNINHWARNINQDNNSHVRHLAGIKDSEDPTEEHLVLAMNTLREKFVVGLMDEMEESLRRFNVFLGIDEGAERSVRCMNKFFGEGAERVNSNSHPEVR